MALDESKPQFCEVLPSKAVPEGFWFAFPKSEVPHLCFHGPDASEWEREGDKYLVRFTVRAHELKPGETCNGE